MHRNIVLVMIQMHKQSCLEEVLIDLQHLIYKSVARIFIKWNHEEVYLEVGHISSDMFHVCIFTFPLLPLLSPPDLQKISFPERSCALDQGFCL